MVQFRLQKWQHNLTSEMKFLHITLAILFISLTDQVSNGVFAFELHGSGIHGFRYNGAQKAICLHPRRNLVSNAALTMQV